MEARRTLRLRLRVTGTEPESDPNWDCMRADSGVSWAAFRAAVEGVLGLADFVGVDLDGGVGGFTWRERRIGGID